MKLKTAKIIVESLAATNERWLKALKAKSKSRPTEEVISVSSWEVLGKLFSPARLQILATLPHSKAKSIAQLAKAMKRDFKNVYNDVIFLAELGLIELEESGPRKTLKPCAKFSDIQFPLAA